MRDSRKPFTSPCEALDGDGAVQLADDTTTRYGPETLMSVEYPYSVLSAAFETVNCRVCGVLLIAPNCSTMLPSESCSCIPVEGRPFAVIVILSPIWRLVTPISSCGGVDVD